MSPADLATATDTAKATAIQPKASTTMDVMNVAAGNSVQECKNKAARIRGGTNVARDCFLAALECFLCLECCKVYCECCADIICCPCEACCGD